MAIDPLMVPYMQRALGGGGFSKRDAQNLLAQRSSPMMSGMMQGGQQGGPTMPTMAGNLGSGQAPSMPTTPFFGSSPSTGDAGQMAGALASAYGNRGTATYDSGTGDWTPGAGGFPSGGGANGSSGFGQNMAAASELASMVAK